MDTKLSAAEAAVDPTDDEAGIPVGSRAAQALSAAGEAGRRVNRERACSVARTINILSDAWAFLILREAFFGAQNFETFQARLQIPRATLTDRLTKLVACGIFRKVASSRDRRQQDYRLTKSGFDLYPSFIALMQFGDRWLCQDAPPLKLIHTACGHESRPRVACSECLEEVTTRDVAYRDGPGAGSETSPPGRSTRRASNDERFLTGRPSSVARALQVIGDRWSFMVVREAFFGARRYDAIQGALGIAPNILTDRLSRFVANGIFERVLYQENPRRFEYVLTPMGRDLYGPFIAMLAWGDRWLADGRPPLILRHRTCGKDFTALVVCDQCSQPINAAQMRYRTAYDPSVFGGLPVDDKHSRTS